MPRDDFFSETKDNLARRVGMRCSNPHCRQQTSGPREDPTKSVNIGIAAHICAASSGGPRFDDQMTAYVRSSAENGIWLCQNCGKVVDNDPQRYTVEILTKWKQISEDAARAKIEGGGALDSQQADRDIIQFFAQCFDRPAFQDPFEREGSMEAFDKAIEDTITAINTGCLRARDGTVLAEGRGKSYLCEHGWQRRMDEIVDKLREVRQIYDRGRKLGMIHVNEHERGMTFYCINDRSIADRIDRARTEALQTFATIAAEAGVRSPAFPRIRISRI
jgi:hypothetical protein